MAFKSGETELAFLTQKRLSACTRLAVLVRNETELGRLAKEYGSLVLLKRDREYPQGSLMEVDPVVASIMSDSTPSMKIDDKGLQLAGSFGEIGKDMITMQLLKKPEPMVTIDVMLP